ncbi:bifunctional 4-hydroxy-2-oxoglutarate aldolase/2-dehydro-3-deoxy-phosphogluconate aldolase [Nocardioides montaniterrae]
MSILDISPVVPVVVLDDPASAVPLARALVEGGVGVIEVTLRTPTALASIERIAEEVPEIVVGAGTITRGIQAQAAVDAGASFLVSPGTTPRLLEAMLDTGVALLPGCSTISEALALRAQGLGALKFFPAEAAGGAPYLSAIAGPLPDLRFCPTGGITLESAPRYLALSNVACVGGTWLAPASVVAAKDWASITATARATMTALSAAPSPVA